MIGRAGRGRGYQWRSYDGRAQPRAVWAMPWPVERPPASDGADERAEARAKVSASATDVCSLSQMEAAWLID